LPNVVLLNICIHFLGAIIRCILVNNVCWKQATIQINMLFIPIRSANKLLWGIYLYIYLLNYKQIFIASYKFNYVRLFNIANSIENTHTYPWTKVWVRYVHMLRNICKPIWIYKRQKTSIWSMQGCFIFS